MKDEVDKICGNCKHCKEISATDMFYMIDCDVLTMLNFPKGSVPTCDKFVEKDPTLSELRDEIRGLKKELRKRKCRETLIIEPDCCRDCCNCRRRCSGPYWYYYPYVTWQTPSTPAPYTAPCTDYYQGISINETTSGNNTWSQSATTRDSGTSKWSMK